MRATGLLLAWLGGATVYGQEPPTPPDAAPSAEALEFFETRVRPVLLERCAQCHGEKKQEAGLRLDRRESALTGGDNGPVIVPGNTDQSRLLAAIGYRDESLQMPPDGPLPEAIVADLRQWIADGAAWPASASPTDDAAAQAAGHWAFRPVVDPPPPQVSDAAWAQSPLDLFVLSRLEQAGLRPSPPADRRTLIRRLSFDLVGLPPTPEEVDAFVADPSPDAVARLVDRLLDSPRYGERWGRHWLDVARYADSKGYKFFGSDEFFAWTYRDWVVRSINEDLPYDQFVVQQLAADLLPREGDTRPLAAMGFLTVGRRFLEDAHDIIDDRIDVVSRGLLGLTVTCARCHDHKFDPIPTADYYSLYGVFAGSVERTRTLYAAGELTGDLATYEAGLAEREGALADYLRRRHVELLHGFRTRVAEYLLAGREAQKLPPTDRFMFVEEPDKLSELVVGRWRTYLDRTQREHDRVVAPWHAFAALSAEEFAARGAELATAFAANADVAKPINPRVAELFATPPADLAEVAQRFGELLATVEARWQEALGAATAAGTPSPVRLEDPDLEELRMVLYGPLSPCDVPETDVEFLVGRPGQAEINALRAKIAEFTAASAVKPPRAMTLEEDPRLSLYNPRLFIRGKPSNLGPEIPRQFLAVVAGAERQPFAEGSGRLELARAIADPGNPLTARVLVNRIWLEHFGAGLVATPSDFGLRSDPPSHPELLDWLASRFVEQGWSLKALHRTIVLSSTYQQQSDDRPECAAVDPDNRLLWRFPRRRLDLEAMRDALLAVSGRLDLTAGGPPVDFGSNRRTVYGAIDRSNLPGLLRTFDFASPDTHSPQRYTTTVPQQALFWMNSPFVVEQARAFVSRPEVSTATQPAGRVRALYRLAFGRVPTERETELALRFTEQPAADSRTATAAAWQYGHGTYDPASQRVTRFEPLGYWQGSRWQAGHALPDARVGWVYLDATGGHPGQGLEACAVRRWTAPADGAVSVRGLLRHAETEGDGVNGRIVSSHDGELGVWTAANGEAETNVERIEVRQGDTLDFVVDCRESGNITCDQHFWAPLVRSVAPAGGTDASATVEWNAESDFAGAGLDPWVRYAQALLMANEFVFVD